jgi:hypothetical protein
VRTGEQKRLAATVLGKFAGEDAAASLSAV